MNFVWNHFKYGIKKNIFIFQERFSLIFRKWFFFFSVACKIWFMNASYTEMFVWEMLKFLKWKVYFRMKRNFFPAVREKWKDSLKIMMLLYPLMLHPHVRKMEMKFKARIFLLKVFYLCQLLAFVIVVGSGIFGRFWTFEIVFMVSGEFYADEIAKKRFDLLKWLDKL